MCSGPMPVSGGALVLARAHDLPGHLAGGELVRGRTDDALTLVQAAGVRARSRLATAVRVAPLDEVGGHLLVLRLVVSGASHDVLLHLTGITQSSGGPSQLSAVVTNSVIVLHNSIKTVKSQYFFDKHRSLTGVTEYMHLEVIE